MNGPEAGPIDPTILGDPSVVQCDDAPSPGTTAESGSAIRDHTKARAIRGLVHSLQMLWSVDVDLARPGETILEVVHLPLRSLAYYWRYSIVLFIISMALFGFRAVLGPVGSWSALGCAIVAVVAGLVALQRWAHTIYVLTSTRIVAASGTIVTRQLSIPITKIAEIKVFQSRLQRMLRIGDVTISSHARPDHKHRFAGVANPRKFADDAVKAIIYSRGRHARFGCPGGLEIAVENFGR